MTLTKTAGSKEIYQVRNRRCLVLKANNGRGSVNWAQGGEYVDLSHPLLRADLEDQMHMLNFVGKLPKDARVKTDFPLFYKRKMTGYTRDAAAHAVDIGEIEIDTQVEELRRTVADLQGKVDTLTEENESLKSENEALVAKAKGSKQ